MKMKKVVMILLRIIILLIRKTKNNLINIDININNIICYISRLLKERIVVLRFIFIYFYIYIIFLLVVNIKASLIIIELNL